VSTTLEDCSGGNSRNSVIISKSYKSALVMVEHKTARTMLAQKNKKGRMAKWKLQMSRERKKAK
jgi:hypothetical protein